MSPLCDRRTYPLCARLTPGYDLAMKPILTPTCPRCGTPPMATLSPEQAICGNEDCGALTWNMTHTAEENEAGVSYHCLDCGKQLPAGATTCECTP